MIQNKFILALLGILLVTRFVYVPWSEWIAEKQESNARLSTFNEKQLQAVENKTRLQSALDVQQRSIAEFKSLIPKLGKNQKANSLWFSLIESHKNKDIKIYNQKVEFEEPVTNEISFITGSLTISGKAQDVMQTVINLEHKTPSVFLDKLNLNQSGRGKSDKLIAQLYLGYWFSHGEAKTL